MASPRHDVTPRQLRRARAELLLEAARAYAWGVASESDVLAAADSYGELCEQDASEHHVKEGT